MNVERKRIIEDRLQRLIEGIKQADYKDSDNEYMARLAKERINELQQRSVYCVDKFVQKLLERVKDKEAYKDILMEGRFAIILARNNFSDIHIEYIDEGPDVKATWNRNTIYFEVTRSRPSEDDRVVQNRAAFVSQDSVESIISKIQGKLPQLQSGCINIIVIWSDTINWLPRRMKEAFKYIQQGNDQNPEEYKDLSGVLFTNGGVNMATLKQVYLFENKEASKPLGPRLFNKLDNLHERNINELQRENEELAAGLRQLEVQESL